MKRNKQVDKKKEDLPEALVKQKRSVQTSVSRQQSSHNSSNNSQTQQDISVVDNDEERVISEQLSTKVNGRSQEEKTASSSERQRSEIAPTISIQ